jgi:CBS domain-containing protein
MSKNVIAVTPEMTLRDALNVFLTHNVRGAPVLSGAHVVGVVSTTDLLDFVAEPPSEMAREEDESAQRDEWVEGEASPSAYFVDLWHQIDDDVSERFRVNKEEGADLLASHTVSEAMTRIACSLSPATPVDAAARYMRDHGIHRVLVQDGEELLGVVTTTDITNAVADHRVGTRSFIFNRDSGFDDRSEWLAADMPDDDG